MSFIMMPPTTLVFPQYVNYAVYVNFIRNHDVSDYFHHAYKIHHIRPQVFGHQVAREMCLVFAAIALDIPLIEVHHVKGKSDDRRAAKLAKREC